MLHAYPIDLERQIRLGFGAGVSAGTFVTTELKNVDLRWERYWERAWLLNLQTSVLFWEGSGWGFEPSLGYGFVLNARDGACAGWRSTCSGLSGVFFFGMTFRYGAWL